MNEPKKTTDMLSNIKKLYYFQLVVFLFVAAFFFIPNESKRAFIFALFIPGGLFMLSGIVLLVMTYKSKVKGWLKTFLLFMRYSSSGFLVSVVLHYLVYGLFMLLFGKDFWDSIGVPDEPFFFIIAIIVCPIVFLVGTVGSGIMLHRKKSTEE